MGIDNLDKTWWEKKVSEPYLKEHYEKFPYLTAPTEYIGGGISDFITEKTPDLFKDSPFSFNRVNTFSRSFSDFAISNILSPVVRVQSYHH